MAPCLPVRLRLGRPWPWVQCVKKSTATCLIGIPRKLSLVGLLCAFVIPAHSTESPRPEDTLFTLYYEFEVAGYCGLVTDGVGHGFRHKESDELAKRAISQSERERLRGKAWQAAHAEWQNRGLGGFRGWCRNEGRAAAARLAQ